MSVEKDMRYYVEISGRKMEENLKGRQALEFFISFFIAVAAGVACHYIIKWLDSDDKGNK